MATNIPAPPERNEDPWFDKRDAFDQAVRTRLNTELSDAALSATFVGNARAVRNIAGSAEVALTSAECAAREVELVGATQSITVTIPAGACVQILNSTDFGLQIKRAGAAKSTPLSAGVAMEVSG